MLAEAGRAVNEKAVTATSGKSLLKNAYVMKVPTLLLKQFIIASRRARCVNSSIICCSALVLLNGAAGRGPRRLGLTAIGPSSAFAFRCRACQRVRQEARL